MEKKASIVKKAKAEAAADCGKINDALAEFGYYISPTEAGASAALKAEMSSISNLVDDSQGDEEDAAPAADAPAAAPAAKSDY